MAQLKIDKAKTTEGTESYRQKAERHGARWLRSREIGVRQCLRKGIGDTAVLNERLAALLDVKGQRQSDMEKVSRLEEELRSELSKLGKKIDSLQSKLDLKKAELDLKKAEADKLRRISYLAKEISENGLPDHRRDSWQKQLGTIG